MPSPRANPHRFHLPDELVGEKVVVRPYRPGDGTAVWEAVEGSREHLRPWMDWLDRHRSLEDSEEFARRAHARWATREDLIVGMWERSTGRYLGGSGLHPRDWLIPWFEIGYWLRAGAEGRGYVTETVRLLLRLAFEDLEAKRVHIQCDSRNHRSAAIPRKLGFVHEGTLRNDSLSPQGELRDTLVFAMVPEDYERFKKREQPEVARE